MRREEPFFGDQELVLVYIAKKLREAKQVESLFDDKDVDYLVEPDRYRGGVLFVRELLELSSTSARHRPKRHGVRWEQPALSPTNRWSNPKADPGRRSSPGTWCSTVGM
ncbi:MAG: hypothetical protein HZB13_08565 [Acidobacteria bacterium]|nr:hypothetical protein [Acidobacteriota bacterium]